MKIMILVEIGLQSAIPFAAGLGSRLPSPLPANMLENVPGKLQKPRNHQTSPQISLPRADFPGGELCNPSKTPAKAPSFPPPKTRGMF